MKKVRIITILLCLILLGQDIWAQNTEKGDEIKSVVFSPNYPLLFLGGGVSIPNASIKSAANFSNLLNVYLEGYIPLVKKNDWSFGLNTGFEYGFDNSNNFGRLPSPYQVSGQSSPPVITAKGSGHPKEQNFKYEAGPSALLILGDKLGVNTSLNVAYTHINQKAFTVTQTSAVNGASQSWDLIKRSETKASGLGIVPKLRLFYMIGTIGVWIEGAYTVASKTNAVSTVYHPEGNAHQDGTYDLGQMNFPSYTVSDVSRRYKAFGINGGIVIGLGSGSNGETQERRLKGKVIRMGDKGIVRGRFSENMVSSGDGASAQNPNTGIIPKMAHLRVFCKDGKKVIKYYDYKGNLYNELYTDVTCDNKTWPINGVEGDMSTDFKDKTMVPLKWNGTIAGMFDIKNPDIFVNANAGITELMKTINDTKNYQSEIFTDAIHQKYLSVVHKDDREFIREMLPIDENGPMNHVVNVSIRCVGSCDGGNLKPCLPVPIPEGGWKCQDCGISAANTTCKSVTGWTNQSGWHHNLVIVKMPLVDENSGVTSTGVLALIDKLLPKDYTAKTVEVSRIGGQKYLSVLASNATKSIILVNKLENTVSSNNWMAYSSDSLPIVGKDLPSMIRDSSRKASVGKKQYAVGHIVLLSK